MIDICVWCVSCTASHASWKQPQHVCILRVVVMYIISLLKSSYARVVSEGVGGRKVCVWCGGEGVDIGREGELLRQ